jgi:hypothetical protein
MGGRENEGGKAQVRAEKFASLRPKSAQVKI